MEREKINYKWFKLILDMFVILTGGILLCCIIYSSVKYFYFSTYGVKNIAAVSYERGSVFLIYAVNGKEYRSDITDEVKPEGVEEIYYLPKQPSKYYRVLYRKVTWVYWWVLCALLPVRFILLKLALYISRYQGYDHVIFAEEITFFPRIKRKKAGKINDTHDLEKKCGPMRKIIKIFLWVVKFSFIAFCLFIWIWILPLGGVIIPAAIDECRYFNIAENFIKEKYGEDIKVRLDRLPLWEFNTGNTGFYTYCFDLNGKEYFFVYDVDVEYLGDHTLQIYGDNAQSDELHQAVNEALDEIYGTRVSLDDIYHKAVTLGWNDSNLYCNRWIFFGKPNRYGSDVEDTIFVTKYTGDNLEEFPIRIYLYYDVGVRSFEEEDLQKLYYEVADTLKEYNIDCKEVVLYCEKRGRDWFKKYDITETSEGIEIVREN